MALCRALLRVVFLQVYPVQCWLSRLAMVLAGGLATALPGVRLCGAYKYIDYVLSFSTVITSGLSCDFHSRR